ncbi:hypothetical protein AB0J20_18225 [Micromonospora costi]|uniref:hypothetical protein n=1 Tax=Micromonospora costi TaxID=1530042 RepID=UPI0033DA8E47
MTTDDSEYREYVRKLFGTRDEPEPTFADTSRNNHVAREGSGNGQQRPADHDDRDFAGALFGVDENNRNLHTD